MTLTRKKKETFDWRRIQKWIIGTCNYTLYVVKPKHPMLSDNDGMCLAAQRKIYISSDVLKDGIENFKEVLFHELEHAFDFFINYDGFMELSAVCNDNEKACCMIHDLVVDFKAKTRTMFENDNARNLEYLKRF